MTVTSKLMPSMRRQGKAMANYLQTLIADASCAHTLPDLSRYATNCSGYVREAAVRRCGQLGQPDLLPIVNERLNDWVPEVREAARQALSELLLTSPKAQLLANLPGMLRLRGGSGRGDSAQWLATFEARLIALLGTDVIAEQARHGDIVSARACIGLLMRYRLVDTHVLIALILGRGDDIVLCLEAVQLIGDLPAGHQPACQALALRSHFGMVRTRALRGLLAQDDATPEARKTAAMRALGDTQSSARYVAREYLGALGVDVRAYYRTLLGQAVTARTAQICLAELAALRALGDTELVRSCAADTRAIVRLAALTAWFKLAAADKDHIAAVALADSAPRVRKFGAMLVQRDGAYLPFEQVARMLEAVGDLRLLLRMAESHPWQWLEWIARLSLRLDREQVLALRLDASLGKWLTQSQIWYDNLGSEQAARLRAEPARSSLRALVSGSSAALAEVERELDARA